MLYDYNYFKMKSLKDKKFKKVFDPTQFILIHTCKSCSPQERLWPWNSYLSVKHFQTKTYNPHMEVHLQKIPSNGEGKEQPNCAFRFTGFSLLYDLRNGFHTNLEFQVPFTKLYSSHMCRTIFLNIMGTCTATILQ